MPPAGRVRNTSYGTLAYRSKRRAPGSVKLRAGGESPRPVRSQRSADLVKFQDRRLKSGWEAARERPGQPLAARRRVPALPRSRIISRASRRQVRMFTGIVAELGE